ncbi:hypothetical protein [Sphaerisporangium corydalis]|uniref:Uncharacterized protein n=1 Tax=Sphaerisporangium corydalis TaxID=1441875 RepID=A0ABV9EPW0_9ACTN|nr:hypothetical protein [Sphaerisporangium corydalis]
MIESVSFALVEIAVVSAIAAGQCRLVDRSRIERFGRLHQLTITPGNGPMVVDYLRTTRRWRAAGLVAGLVGYLLVNAATGGMGVGIEFGGPFLGWYTGAMIAEITLRRPPAGLRPPPPAGLRPPSSARPLTGTRLPLSALISVPALILSVLTMACGAVVLVLGVTDGSQRLLLLPAAVTLLSGVLQLRLLRLPVPVAHGDTVRACLAMRSRSLHVLAAGSPVLLATALTEFTPLAASGPPLAGSDYLGITVDLSGILFVGLLLLAWITARRPHPIRLDARNEPSALSGTPRTDIPR